MNSNLFNASHVALDLGLASRAFARSARSTPTRIFDAFQSWTKLIMFFAKNIQNDTRAVTSGHVKCATNGCVSPMGVFTHFMRYNETKNSSFPAQITKSVRYTI
jgi:hypothetical protein